MSRRPPTKCPTRHAPAQPVDRRPPRLHARAARPRLRRRRRRGDLPRQPERRADPVPDARCSAAQPDRPGAGARSAMHIYNQWLADFCSVEPERHVGLVHLPMWDIDAAIARARAGPPRPGSQGVNFPAPRHRRLPPYNDRAWEPFWSACEDLDDAAHDPRRRRRSRRCSRARDDRAACRSRAAGGSAAARCTSMIFGGVFERHPDLQAGAHRAAGRVVDATRCNEIDSACTLRTDGNAAAARAGAAPAERVLRARTCSSARASSPAFEAEHAVRRRLRRPR